MSDWHWVDISEEPAPAYAPLAGDVDCDLTVIGAGYSGLAVARRAAELGARVRVLEKGRIGSGASGRNGGFVVPQFPYTLTPRDVEGLLGPRKGARLAGLVQGAAADLFDFIRAHDIRCDAQQNGWVAPAHNAERMAAVREVCGQWRALGAGVRLMSGDEVRDRLGAHGFVGGWIAPSGGSVNPYALAVGSARVAARAGALLHEHSPALAIERAGATRVVSTPAGRVRTAQVIVCGNGYVGALLPAVARSYVPVHLFHVMTRPLGHNLRASVLPGRHCFTDVGKVSWFSHYDSGHRLISGGALVGFGDNRGRARVHARQVLGSVFPQLGRDIEFDAYWEGTVAINDDHLPALQQVDERVWSLGGYSTRGVALSNALAPLVGEFLCDARTADEVPVDVRRPRAVAWRGLKTFAARFAFPVYKRMDRRGHG